jgi:hypothetical protein
MKAARSRRAAIPRKNCGKDPQALTIVATLPFERAMTPAVQASCLDALVDAMSEVCGAALGVSMRELGSATIDVSVDALGSRPGLGPVDGAFMSLVTPEEPIQVGLVVERPGSQVLAKALLGMEAGDEDLPESDVSDAMCEVINMVAGGLKRRADGRLSIVLGLPLFVSGEPLPNQQHRLSARALELGSAKVSVILLTHNSQAAPASRSAVGTTIGGRAPVKEHSA